MATAEKRNGVLTGRWWGDVLLKQHGRFKHAFDTRKGAEAYEAYVRVTGQEPPTISAAGMPVPGRGRSFAEVAEQCKRAGGPRGAWAQGRDPTGVQRLDWAVRKIGAYDIADVTRALVREKITEPLQAGAVHRGRAAPLKQGTINRYLAAVSAVLTWAVQEGILNAKPTLQFQPEHDKVERATIDPGLEDRVVAILEAQGHTAHATCVRFLAATGMRRGELYKLRPEQIKHDHIALERAQSKTNQSRLVYVRPDLARKIRALIAAGALPHRLHLLRMFQAAAKCAGSESHVVLHGLRHTLATRMRRAGVEQSIRMAMLGHTSEEVHRGYDHVDLADQRRAVEQTEKLRGELTGNVVQFAPTQPSQALDKTGTE